MDEVTPTTELLDAMTPEQKLRATLRLYWSARALKTAALRVQHHSWSEAEIDRAVRDVFAYHRG